MSTDLALPAVTDAEADELAAVGIVADEARPGRWRDTRGSGPRDRGLTTSAALRRARRDVGDRESERDLPSGLSGDELARYLGGPAALALPSPEAIDAHLDAGGWWLVAYRGGGTVRAYRGVPSQREAVRELAATGASLAWLAVGAGTP